MREKIVSDTREWYIKIEGKKEGPYSVMELRHDQRITPETLVWKKGFEKWVPIGKVRELRKVFADEEELEPEQKDFEHGELPTRITPDGLVIDMREEPPNIIIWIALAVILIAYLIYKLNSIL